MPRGVPNPAKPMCKGAKGQCGKVSTTLGFCPGHYQRMRQGRPIDELLQPRSSNGVRKPLNERESVLRVKRTYAQRRAELDIPSMSPLPDQQVAIDKLRHVSSRLVGDSMGVGKTVTGIGLDFAMRKDRIDHRDGPTLIICEKIGIDVWDYHLRAMGVPVEQILLVDPTDRSEFVDELNKLIAFQGYKAPRMTKKGVPDKRIISGPKTDRPQYRYYVCHWDVLIHIEELTKRNNSNKPMLDWSHVIADEVHLAKNRNAQRTEALKKIKSEYKTGLSGTPADDKPQDLWSVLNWLYPTKYSSFWRWVKSYIDVEESENGYRKLGGPIKAMIPILHREISPFYIRRTLLEVNSDMPEKIWVRPIETVVMSKSQRFAYDSMKDKALAIIGDAEDGRGGFTLMAPAVIAVLTRLQQMAMATLTPEWNVDEAELEDSDGFDTDWDFPDIVMSKPSPKLDRVMNMITTNDSESFVVFTQFRAMVDLVEEECQAKGIPVSKIHGGITDKNKRTQEVLDFQSGKTRVFVGTIAAAGKSITLTKANHVIFMDRSWNPSKNEQAEDRLWRRTQKNTVHVHDIDTEDSIDQWRRTKIDKKHEWIKQLLERPGSASVRDEPLKGKALRDSLITFLQS